MSNVAENNKRLAKNVLVLYFRLALSMIVSLYASRVVLNVLGAADYGTYNVVGGIVVMLAFVNTTLSDSAQRFLSFDLGRRDERASHYFQYSLYDTPHIGLDYRATGRNHWTVVLNPQNGVCPRTHDGGEVGVSPFRCYHLSVYHPSALHRLSLRIREDGHLCLYQYCRGVNETRHGVFTPMAPLRQTHHLWLPTIPY